MHHLSYSLFFLFLDKESSSPHPQPVCNRVSTDKNVLCSLREMYKSFKLSLSTELMRKAHVLNQKEKQDEAFGRSDSPSTEEGVSCFSGFVEFLGWVKKEFCYY